ncbi:MAG: cupin domain-containing protein [Deltaproteobacteria bacterium]|nr:cupin domain-containing protein [Myxococcales bacterium]MDP3213365.1 cupin domain-containing protein [Deltaproteobacteria bacterium]
MDPELSALIARLDLRPHPEGGWYRETFRDPRAVHAVGFDGPRSASTAIYFLLAEGNFSALHRIRSDEVWHHYAGGDVEVTALSPDGALRTLVVGHRAADAAPQAVVPAGEWFGARVAPGGRWALVGCTVAPGFEFSDLELADRVALTASHPAHADIIAALTR